MKIQKQDEYGEVYFVETDEEEVIAQPKEERIEAIEAIVRRKQGQGKTSAERSREYRLRQGDTYRASHAKYMRNKRAEGKAK